MTGWQIFALMYLSFGTIIIMIQINFRKSAGLPRDRTLVGILVTLLVGPIQFLVISILRTLYPPSGDPVDLIYSRLSYTEGKHWKTILNEIRAAGETLGWGEEHRISVLLQVMTQAGYAHQKKEVLLDVTETLDVISRAIGKLIPQGATPREEEIRKKFVAAKRHMGELRTQAHLTLSISFYYKGTPPRKKDKISSFLWEPTPA